MEPLKTLARARERVDPDPDAGTAAVRRRALYSLAKVEPA